MPVEILDDQLKGIRTPEESDHVYKDECVLSFDTPDSETGLYISLVSFLGFGEDYYQLYYKKTKHSVFLHHKRTKTELPQLEDEGPEKKITRLAIGVEGGFTADTNPKYEYTNHYNIVALPGPVVLPLSDPSLARIIKNSADAVILATSSYKKLELDALNATWDGELRIISRHAEDLLQLANGKVVSSSGWKCEKCDLTSNLWLNLTDGSIMCGRRNFDGSGGNNHGVEHYKTTGYPLAVKLGTISQNGTADVFSYDEDDLVLDPNLSKHLAHFGLNIGQLEKTDKSMAELEIDLNQKLGEWTLGQESGSALVPVYGPGRTGLVNLGNTCYLNSVMQLVFTIPNFIRSFVDDYPNIVDACDFRDPANDFIVQMGKLGFGLCSGKYSQPPADGSNTEQPGISPRMFMQIVTRGHPEFSTSRQQDAQEFFLHLINVLEKNSRRRTNPAEIFKFRVEDRFECTDSNKVKYTNRTEYCLALPIPLGAATNLKEVAAYNEAKKEDPKIDIVRPNIPLQACVQELTQVEWVENFYSSFLKRKTVAKKTMRLATFPDYLMVHLKKFAAEGGQCVKLDVAIDVPDIIDLEMLRGQGLQPDEEPLPGDEAPPVEINQEVLSNLLEFGCPLEPAKKAVYFTNGVGLPEAYAWYEQHINDVDLMTPFVAPGTQPSKQNIAVSDENVAIIVSMGFTQQRATRALMETDNNVGRACDWIFSHVDDEDADIESPPEAFTDGPSKYRLRAFITHMGTSATVGHYVCHIHQDGQWIIFNDSKVALSVNPPKELAYLYLYERITA